MRFYNGQHEHWCGIDLHARTMYIVCILDAQGRALVHQNLRACPEAFLAAIAPYREGLVVAAECVFRIAYPANRTGVVEHFPDRAVRKSVAVDLALLERYDELISDLEADRVRRAKQHDPQAFHRLRTIPGVGKVLALDDPLRDPGRGAFRFRRAVHLRCATRLAARRSPPGRSSAGAVPRWATST